MKGLFARRRGRLLEWRAGTGGSDRSNFPREFLGVEAATKSN